MNIEIEPMIDDPIVISGMVGHDIGEAYIGRKKFIEVGKFEYEWFMEYLSQDDLYEIARAILFVADHMGCQCEEEENSEQGD